MGINTFPQGASSPYTAGTTFGNTASRPASPSIGQTYYNGSTASFEIWNGTIWSAINSTPSAVTSVTPTDNGANRPQNNGSTSVAFVPATVGGLATNYLVTSSPGGYTASGSSSPIIITGMQTNTSYTYSVIASNSLGNSPAVVSLPVTATTIPGVAGTPTATSILDGSGNISVSWSAAVSGGGGTTTSYVVTSSPGGITSASTTGTTATLSGLTNGQAYTFTVVASNANGSAAASAASNSVTSQAGLVAASYLVVGGGASSWYSYNHGAGGGGAVKTGTTLYLGDTFTVTVGAAGTTSTAGSPAGKIAAQGKDSTLATITSKGGGAPGGAPSGSADNGAAGGNGGGGYSNSTTVGAGGASNDNGYAGGTTGNGSTYSWAAGGGGAGGAGGTVNAGPGVPSSITGTTIYYGPGGAGGQYSNTGATATDGAARQGSAPVANNGAGCGGASSTQVSGSAGVVVIQYPTTFRALTTIPGTLTYTYDTTTLAGSRTYKFTAGTGTVTY